MLQLAKQEEMNSILDILEEGIQYLATQKVNQWQNGYPNEEVLTQDIAKKQLFTYTEDQIVGIAALIPGTEPTYGYIEDGKWLNNEDYLTIHRMTVSQKRKSRFSATTMMKEIEEYCLRNNLYQIRIDTHKDNMPMQYLLKKCGFTYCGIIYLADGDQRLAFQKCLKEITD